jgi:hypothetical protein
LGFIGDVLSECCIRVWRVAYDADTPKSGTGKGGIRLTQRTRAVLCGTTVAEGGCDDSLSLHVAQLVNRQRKCRCGVPRANCIVAGKTLSHPAE